MKQNRFKLMTRLSVNTALGLFIMGVSHASTFYVAPDGNDQAAGTEAEPLATLDGARLKVREIKANDPVTVLIRGGEYTLSETIVFTPEDSGSKESPITYKAYEGETPVFTGGKKLSDWKKVSSYPEGTSEQAKGNLWYCDIPAELKGKWQITSLYDGTRMLKRSQSGQLKTSKNQVVDGFNIQPKKLGLSKKGYQPGDTITYKRELYFEGNDLREWKNLTDIEILTSPRNGWLVNYLPLESIDTSSKRAIYGIDATYSLSQGNKYFVENAIDYLDESGEWVFNSKEGRIYLWPEKSIGEMDIRAPYLQEFIRVEGIEDQQKARFINFEGLTFRHGLRDTWKVGDRGLQHDWEMYDKGNAILRFRHAEDCVVKGNVFESSSGSGVRVDLYGKRIEISDNILRHLGGTGILLSGYAPGTKDENKNHKVTNNYLHHIGTIYKHSPGIFIAQSGHNLISHNTIHHLDYNGMVISGCRPGFFTLHSAIPQRREWIKSLRMDEVEAYLGAKVTPETQLTINELAPFLHARENIIEYNEIYRVMLGLHDGNGIYFSGMGNNNIARRNYVHDLGGDRGFIRLDDHSGPTQIIENVGRNIRFMFVTKGPCEYRNNFAINARGFSNGIRVKMNLDACVFYSPKGRPSFGKKGNYIFDNLNRVSNSIIFGPARSLKTFSVGEDVIAQERRGKAKAGMLFVDPQFDEAAFEQKIFRFKPGSPAEKLGILPIDLSEVGSTLAPFKADLSEVTNTH